MTSPKFSSKLRYRLGLLREEMRLYKEKPHSGVYRYQMRYVPEYSLLFMEFRSPFGVFSRKALPISHLESTESIYTVIFHFIQELADSLNAAARSTWPSRSLDLMWNQKLTVRSCGKYIMPHLS